MKDPNDTRDIGPRPGSPLWIHMTAVTGAGVVVLAWAASQLGMQGLNHLARSPGFWVIALLVVVGEVRPIATPGKSGPDAPSSRSPSALPRCSSGAFRWPRCCG